MGRWIRDRSAGKARPAQATLSPRDRVEQVADQLLRQDWLAGAWAADIGFFSHLYVTEARKILARPGGTLPDTDSERAP